MRRPFIALLVVFAGFVTVSMSINRIFNDSVNSARDQRDAVVAAQIAFPLLFRRVGPGGWNRYASEKPISDLIMEEDLEETELGKVRSELEANGEIDRVRTFGLDRSLYRSEFNTVLLDGTLTIMGTANYSYTERYIYLRSGGGMVIPCMLASIPMQSFRWYDDVDGSAFSSKFSGALRANDRKQLSVDDGKPMMSGKYSCSGTHNGHDVTNVVYLHVYRIAEPGLLTSVFFRTTNCESAQIDLRKQEILGYLCGDESFETCVDESMAECYIETEVQSNLRGRLELNFIRYDTECQSERAGRQCGAQQIIGRILEKNPFRDLRSKILRYINEDDQRTDTHSGDYLFDPVRTLAEGYYLKQQVYRCPPGFMVGMVEDKPACLPCFAGTSKANLGRETVCGECDIGFYAPSAALQFCVSCPSELGPIAERKGNKRQDQCFPYQPPQPTSEIALNDFAVDNDATTTEDPMKNKINWIIIFTVGFFIIVAAIGKFLYCRRRTRAMLTADQRLKHTARPGEKEPFAPGRVPSVATLPGNRTTTEMTMKPLGSSHGRRRTYRTKKKGQAKDEGEMSSEDSASERRKIRGTNDAEKEKTKTSAKQVEEMRSEATNSEATKLVGEMRYEATNSKATEATKDPMDEATELKANVESQAGIAGASKFGRRSQSSKKKKDEVLASVRSPTVGPQDRPTLPTAE